MRSPLNMLWRTRRTEDRLPASGQDAGHRSRGQSIVELVIILPVLLLIVMAALDMGRVFLGWVVLNNAARVGANYAALHPDAWGSPGNAAEQTTYSNLVTGARNDAAISLTDCDTASIPDPAFPNGKDIGDYAIVVLDCTFTPITPIIGDVFASSGNALGVTARSVFPIRSGVIAGSAVTPPPSCLTEFSFEVDPVDTLVVQFTDETPATASGWIWNFGDTYGAAVQNPSKTYAAAGTYTVELRSNSNGVPCTPDTDSVTVAEPTPTPDPDATATPVPTDTPAPTATPACQIPSFIGDKKNTAQATWDAANFSTAVALDPAANQNANWTIESQSIVGGQGAPCNVTIVISPDDSTFPS